LFGWDVGLAEVGVLVVGACTGVRVVGARVEVLVAGARVTFSVGTGRSAHPHGLKNRLCMFIQVTVGSNPLSPYS
jgi:hypothetical protein